jgi:hypothetical protein
MAVGLHDPLPPGTFTQPMAEFGWYGPITRQKRGFRFHEKVSLILQWQFASAAAMLCTKSHRA